MLYATGKRKSAIAKVRVLEGGRGLVTMNNSDCKSYLGRDSLASRVMSPFKAINFDTSKIDVKIDALGGGVMGQSEAARHGISKILSKICDESSKKILRELGYITRDSRAVESKKSGFKKARKKPQFSKR
jgi:small subunit ribosomal protein S9